MSEKYTSFGWVCRIYYLHFCFCFICCFGLTVQK